MRRLVAAPRPKGEGGHRACREAKAGEQAAAALVTGGRLDLVLEASPSNAVDDPPEECVSLCEDVHTAGLPDGRRGETAPPGRVTVVDWAA